jgi:hypothetical protein
MLLPLLRRVLVPLGVAIFERVAARTRRKNERRN